MMLATAAGSGSGTPAAAGAAMVDAERGVCGAAVGDKSVTGEA
jgi:hypothetical protein